LFLSVLLFIGPLAAVSLIAALSGIDAPFSSVLSEIP
jgi:hypothetical protein